MSTGSTTPVSFPSLATLYPQLDAAPAAWARGLTGSGVGVAGIDSGVQDLSDFAGRVVQ